jgi:hypothetical protein
MQLQMIRRLNLLIKVFSPEGSRGDLVLSGSDGAPISVSLDRLLLDPEAADCDEDGARGMLKGGIQPNLRSGSHAVN